jgi:hypothetical protein
VDWLVSGESNNAVSFVRRSYSYRLLGAVTLHLERFRQFLLLFLLTVRTVLPRIADRRV